MSAVDRGSNGALQRACSTNDRSHVGTRLRRGGLKRSVPFKKRATKGWDPTVLPSTRA